MEHNRLDVATKDLVWDEPATDPPYIVNLEFHTYSDTDVVRTLWRRQAVLDHRHNRPVLSVLVLVLRLATKRFGEPDAAIKSISDLDRLESLSLRIVDQEVRDWTDLLQGS